MKLNKKTRIIGLSVILAVIIASGVFLLLGGLDMLTKRMDALPGNTNFTVGEGMKYVSAEPRILPMTGQENAELIRHSDSCVALYGMSITDVATGEALITFPQELFTEMGAISSVYLTENNEIAMLTLDTQNNMLLFWLYDDKLELLKDPIELKDVEGEWFGEGDMRYFHVEQFAFDGENIYLVSAVAGQGVLQIFDIEGNPRYRHDGFRFDFDGNGKLYVAVQAFDSGGTGFMRLDLKTLVIDYETVVLDNVMEIQAHAKSGRVFCWTGIGQIITYSAEDGKEIEMVFDTASDKLMSDAAWSTWGFCVGADGEIYFVSANKDEDPWQIRYICYGLQKVEKVERTESLTITAALRSEFMEQLITKYEYENPAVKINYEYEYNDNRSFVANSTTYYDKLTVRLLTGDIGDIVMLGGDRTTRRELLKTDVLVDLSPFLEKSPDRSQYDERMLNGIKLDNAIRAMPLSEYFPLLEVDITKLNELGIDIDYKNMTWSEFLGLTKVLEEKAPDVALIAGEIDYTKPEDAGLYLQRMLTINSADLINIEEKTVDLQQQWFVDLLNQWKEATKSPCFWKRIDIGMNTATDPIQGKALFYIDGGGSEMGLRRDGDKFYRYAAKNKDGREHVYVSLPKGELNSNRIAYSWDLYGISAASTKQALAWDFLEFAAREDNQQLQSLISIPLNTKARSLRLERNGRDYEKAKTSESDLAQDILGMCEQVDYLYDSGDYKHFLYQAALRFLNDEVTLDEALKTAEHDIWIRLNE